MWLKDCDETGDDDDGDDGDDDVIVIMVTRGCGGRGRLGQSVGRFLHPAEASSSLKKSFSSAIMIL